MMRVQKKKIWRLLHESQGFTLVEIIVALIIAGIIIALAAGIIFSGSSLISNVTNRDLDKQTAESAAKFTADKINLAKSVTVLTPAELGAALNRKNILIYIGDEHGVPSTKGRLYFRKADAAGSAAIDVFGEAAYHSHTLTLTYYVDKVEPDQPKAIRIVTSVYNQNELLAKGSRSTQILNAPPIPPASANPALYPPQLPPLHKGEWGGATEAIVLEIE